MPEVSRIRNEEFNNLRPLILFLCFVWGVAMGFMLNFFRPPEVDPATLAQNRAVAQSQAAAAPQLSETERRYAGAPTIANIDPAPLPASAARMSFEDAVIEPPNVVLTTQGGLTGKTASRPNLAAAPASVPSAPVPVVPLIPDLDPF